jgi:hypothetical protein
MAALKQQHAAAAAAAAAAVVAAASGGSTRVGLSPFGKPGLLPGEALPASGVNPLLANHTASLAAVLGAEGGLGSSGMSPLMKAAHMQVGPMASHMEAAWVPEVPTQLPLGGALGGEACGSPSSPWANWSVDSSGEWPYSPAKGSPVRSSMQQQLQALQQKHLLAEMHGRSASFSGSHCNSPCGWWSEADVDSAAASPMHAQAGQQDFATLLGEAAALNATTWTGGLGAASDSTLLQTQWGGANAAAMAAATAAAAQVHKSGSMAALEAAAAAQLMGTNPALLQASLLGAQAAQAAQAAAALGLQQQLDAQVQALQLQLLLKQQQEGYSPRGMAAARAGLRSMANQPSR